MLLHLRDFGGRERLARGVALGEMAHRGDDMRGRALGLGPRVRSLTAALRSYVGLSGPPATAPTGALPSVFGRTPIGRFLGWLR